MREIESGRALRADIYTCPTPISPAPLSPINPPRISTRPSSMPAAHAQSDVPRGADSAVWVCNLQTLEDQ
jgi:hypothetical protein